MKKTLTALLAAVALVGAVPAGAHAAPAEKTATVEQLVSALPVAAEHRDGYVRTAFKHWIDADKDGCNTRAEVLKDEAIEAPDQIAGCKLSGGEWFSYYDDKVVDGPSSLDIDHMVPLAEAWDSGAYEWTAQRLQDYANDLGYSRSLVAVSAKENRSKADKDIAQWLPPAADAKCHYVADWVAVKTRWGLAVDEVEKGALERAAESCPSREIQVPLAN